MENQKFKTVDEYFASLPKEKLSGMNEIRDTIRKAIPEAEEVISYNMPAFKYKRILVYFALSKNHIGFYPTPEAIKAFENQIQKYKYAKGSVQFPLNQPLPLELIENMARFRLEEEKRTVK